MMSAVSVREPAGGAPEAPSFAQESALERVAGIIARLGSVAVAFSGGADSTLLLALALRTLGVEKVLAVTADSPTLPRRELAETRALAAELGARQIVVATEELQDGHFVANPPDRCFYCKQELFRRLRALADREGLRYLAYGATADDLGDYRPGMRAAAQAGAVAPLLEAGLGKQQVRELSRALGLRTWDKPSMACLSSRFPYGREITREGLTRVEQGEEFLRYALGYRQVRVRDHGEIARIEIEPAEFAHLLDQGVREQMLAYFKTLGYTYIALDLQGFRSGSMNDSLVVR